MFAPDDIRALVAKAEAGYWGPLARAVTIVENSPPWDVTVPTVSPAPTSSASPVRPAQGRAP